MPFPSGRLVFPLLLCAVVTARAQTPAAPAESMAGMHHDHAPSTPSTTLEVRLGDQKLSLTLADLQAMPQTTVTVVNEHNKATETYSGPLVSAILAKAGLTLGEKTQRQVLDSFVTAAGTDGYFVLFSGAELQPGLHRAETIVAIAQSGQPLTRTGAFQLIDPADVKPARWVRNLTQITVRVLPSQP